MQHSKKQLITAMIFCAVVIVAVAFLNYILVPHSSLINKFEKYKLVDGKIQTLIVGSSIDDAIEPSIVTRAFQTNTFSFTPQSGFPETFYYILLNALQTNAIERAIVGWDILQNTQVPHYSYPHAEEFYRCLAPYAIKCSEIMDYVRLGVLKEPYTYGFFEYASFPENLPLIKSVLKSKADARHNKGYAYFSSVALGINTADPKRVHEPIDATQIEKPNFNFHKVVDLKYEGKIDETDYLYMEKICKLCKERGVKLYFIYNPAPQVVIDTLPNYDELLEASRTMFARLGATYIDVYDESYFPNITDNKNFRDCPGHISSSDYSIRYSKAICKWILDKEKGGQ